MKKTRIFLVFIGITFSVFANAGQVYGSITNNNRSVGTGVSVSIKCQGISYDDKTDRYGSYAIYVSVKGKCTLNVDDINKKLSYDIYSHKDPARYDFDLVENNEKYFLRRR